MDWASAEFMANVDKIILEEGYGCNVELVPGATMTTFASMDTKGVPDVAPELWANAVQTAVIIHIVADLDKPDESIILRTNGRIDSDPSPCILANVTAALKKSDSPLNSRVALYGARTEGLG